MISMKGLNPIYLSPTFPRERLMLDETQFILIPNLLTQFKYPIKMPKCRERPLIFQTSPQWTMTVLLGRRMSCLIVSSIR